MKKDFDEMKFVFSVGLNEVDLTKLNILSQDELIGIVEWQICLYEEIINIDYLARCVNFMM